jgi:hypothetical protein
MPSITFKHLAKIIALTGSRLQIFSSVCWANSPAHEFAFGDFGDPCQFFIRRNRNSLSRVAAEFFLAHGK